MTATSSPQPPLSTTMINHPHDQPRHHLLHSNNHSTYPHARRHSHKSLANLPHLPRTQLAKHGMEKTVRGISLTESDPAEIRLKGDLPETGGQNAQKVTSADTEVSVSADDSVPGQRDEIDQSDVARDDDFVSPGITSITEEEKGQMTIFYSGKVNVYNEVPAEKLAASPLQFPPEAPVDGTGPLTCHLQAPCIRASTGSSAMILTTLQTAEGSASRKASVHRYLEKRKDRFKSKRKAESSTCASLDAHLSQSRDLLDHRSLVLSNGQAFEVLALLVFFVMYVSMSLMFCQIIVDLWKLELDICEAFRSLILKFPDIRFPQNMLMVDARSVRAEKFQYMGIGHKRLVALNGTRTRSEPYDSIDVYQVMNESVTRLD
ncbi:TIFY 4B-like protein isoform X1 [Tanacetum coccineum]